MSLLHIWYSWDVNHFTDRGGIEGSFLVLILWASCAPVPLGSWVLKGLQRWKLGNTGVPFVSPFSWLLRWCNLTNKDNHSRPNHFFFESCTWRWVKHFLKRWRRINFHSPQTQLQWKPSPICLMMDCLLVSSNGARLVDKPGALPSEKHQPNQSNQFLADFCWKAFTLILGLHLVWNSPLVRQDKQLYFLAKYPFDYVTE